MPNTSIWRRVAPAAVAAVVVFFLVGGSAYAYNSPGVVPGNPLYFMKNNLEKIEGWVARHPDAQAQFHNRMADRRLAEARFLGLGSEKAQEILVDAAAELDMSVEDLRADLRDPKTRVEIMEELADNGFAFAEAWQEHREAAGQGKAMGLGLGRGLGPMATNDTDVATNDWPRLEDRPGMGFGRGLSEEARELRETIFSDEDLTPEEKRAEFHKQMRELIEEKIEAQNDEKDEGEDEDES
jgi:hypothetical protein